MNCREIKEQSSDYLDRRLTPPETALFREHLRSCPDCRGEVEELRKTVALVGSLDEIETRPDFLVQVNNKIDRGGLLRRCGRRLFEPWRIKIPLEAAALLAVTTLALYVYHRPPESAQYSATLSQRTTKAPRAELSRQQQLEGSAESPVDRLTPAPAVPEISFARSKPDAAQAPAGSDQKNAPRVESAARSESEARSAVGQVAEQRQRTVQAAMSPPSPKRVVVASENVGLLSNRIKSLVPELGGRMLGERAFEDGLVLAIELPQSREPELRSALQKETGAESAEARATLESPEAALRQQPAQARSDAPMLQRSRSQLEKFALKDDDPTVIIEIHIRQKK
jgi:hypothetical protein